MNWLELHLALTSTSTTAKILLLSSCLSGIMVPSKSTCKTMTVKIMVLTLGNALENMLVLRSCCTYPGYNLTYECTVVGDRFGFTVWRGSAFDCKIEEIPLQHHRFTDGVAGECNNGSLVAHSLREQDGFFTSQLNVTFTTALIGKSIECVHDSLFNTTTVGSLNISTSGKQHRYGFQSVYNGFNIIFDTQKYYYH